MVVAHADRSPSRCSTCGRFRSGSARRGSRSSASPAWSSCSSSVLSIAEGFGAAMQRRRLARSRARDAQRRRQRDDERPQRAGDRHHQAGARHLARRTDGAMASAELFVIIDLPKTIDATRRPTCRCAASSRRRSRCATRCRSSSGRMLQFGTNEVVVGRAASRPVRGSDGRRRCATRGRTRWKVVGIFEADGGVAETEIWCDARVAAGRLSARQHLSVGAGAARVAGSPSTRSRTG